MSDSEKERLINEIINKRDSYIKDTLVSGKVNLTSGWRNVAIADSKKKSYIPSIPNIVFLVFAILIVIIFFVIACKKLYELYI